LPGRYKLYLPLFVIQYNISIVSLEGSSVTELYGHNIMGGAMSSFVFQNVTVEFRGFNITEFQFEFQRGPISTTEAQTFHI